MCLTCPDKALCACQVSANQFVANQFVSDGDIGSVQALEVHLSSDATMVKAGFLHQDMKLEQGLSKVGSRPGEIPNNPEYPQLTM